ncbi:MAG: hypothetical protein ACXVPR_02825 [Actinomycetota bacterium]
MPVDERAVKGAERCATHPARATVGACDVCGRPLCVGCAIPVRGRVLGAECLPEVLGDDTPETPVAPWRRPARSVAEQTIGAVLAVAVLTTLLPWTRFGTGSGFAGGWSADRRWSMLAAAAAVVSIGLWLWSVRRPVVARGAAIVGGTLILCGSVLAMVNPPPFTKPALAPWVAAAAAAGAIGVGAFTRTRAIPPRV